MKKLEDMGNEAVQAALGMRLKRERLNQNVTQAVLAKQAGISRRTLVAAEKGEGTTLLTLIRLLRGLEKMDQLDQFLPEPTISPIQLAKLKGKVRQKASGILRYPTDHNTTWKWKED